MAVIILVIGLALVLAGYRNTWSQLGQLLQNDAPGFLKWGGAILIIGTLGYIPNMRVASRLLLALVLLVLVISNQGLFSQLQQAITQSPRPIQVQQPPTITANPEIQVDLPQFLTSTNNPITSVANAAASLGKLLGGFFGF